MRGYDYRHRTGLASIQLYTSMSILSLIARRSYSVRRVDQRTTHHEVIRLQQTRSASGKMVKDKETVIEFANPSIPALPKLASNRY